MPRQTLIELRQGTSAAWAAAGTDVLGVGEPGVEIDTRNVKWGDGVTAWSKLPYATLNGPILLAFGLVDDGGTTDNTAQMAALEAEAAAAGGGIIAYPGTQEGFGCNFSTSKQGITHLGVHRNDASSAAGTPQTRFCGLVSENGTQTNVFAVENPQTTLWGIDIDAGAIGGSQGYQAQTGLLNDAPDTRLIDCSPRNGTLVSFYETTNSERAYYHGLCPSQADGSLDPTYYVKAGQTSAANSPTGTTAAGSNQVTAVSSLTWIAVGAGISGAGIPAGTTITAVNAGASSLTLSANATASAAGVTLTIGLGNGASFGITGTIGAGGFQFTITDGVHVFTAADVGHQISGPGITPGTYILTLNSATNVTLSQQCTVAAGIVITEYQGDCAWLAGSDSNLTNSVFNFGTKRLKGSGQISGLHCTFSGTSGCNNVIFEGRSTFQCANLYTDSSPLPADGSPSAPLVHTTATAGAGVAVATSLIVGWQVFQVFPNTTGNQQPAYIENDTSSALNINGGILHCSPGQRFTSLVALTAGNNLLVQVTQVNINAASSLASSGGVPVLLASGASPYPGSGTYGQRVGQVSVNYAGTFYGATSTLIAVNGGAAPASGTAIENTYAVSLFVTETFTTTSAAGTMTVAISPDNATWTNLGTETPGISGAVSQLAAMVPPGWWVRYTFSNATAQPLVVLG